MINQMEKRIKEERKTSMRLAKICSLLGLSMDYVMGLKEKPDGKM